MEHTNEMTWQKPVRKVRKEGWINIYSFTDPDSSVAMVKATKEQCDKEQAHGRTACIHIEWEEEE